MATYDRVRELPLEIDSYRLEGLEVRASHDFTRLTTDPPGGRRPRGRRRGRHVLRRDQLALRAEGPTLPLAGSHTLDSFSQLLEGLSLFPSGPGMHAFLDYRRWAYESAALDLRSVRPECPRRPSAASRSRSRSSCRSASRIHLPDPIPPPRALPVAPLQARSHGRLGRGAGRRSSARPARSTPSTSRAPTRARRSTSRRSDSLPHGCRGVPVRVDRGPRPERRDRPVLDPYRDRITWDALIHSVADIAGLPFPPKTINFKPSRFGSVQRLRRLRLLRRARIAVYGGGQWEPDGRGHIQYLASLFHPTTPNDVAPAAFNIHRLDPPPGLPTSPLEPCPGRLASTRSANSLEGLCRRPRYSSRGQRPQSRP